MTKKDKEAIRQKIGDTFDNWLTVLRVGGYGFSVLFPEDEGYEASDTGGFAVQVLYPYKQARLMVPQDYIDNYDKKKSNIRDSLLHEALHLVMWRFAHLAYSRHTTKDEMHDAEEELTDHLTSVVSYLVDSK